MQMGVTRRGLPYIWALVLSPADLGLALLLFEVDLECAVGFDECAGELIARELQIEGAFASLNDAFS